MARSSDGEGDADSGADLSLDAIFDILSHHHRRRLLRALREAAERSLSEEEVISRIEEQERDRTGETQSWDHISAALHHIHHPKLTEAGLVAYDDVTQEYQYHPDEQVEKWLDLIESEHGPESG